MTIDIGSLTQQESIDTFKELMLIIPQGDLLEAIMDGLDDGDKAELLVQLEEWDNNTIIDPNADDDASPDDAA